MIKRALDDTEYEVRTVALKIVEELAQEWAIPLMGLVFDDEKYEELEQANYPIEFNFLHISTEKRERIETAVKLAKVLGQNHLDWALHVIE